MKLNYNEAKLLAAAKNGALDKIKELIFNKVNINVQNSSECTPLMYAVIYNQISALRLLLENNADPNIPDDDKSTPLMRAESVEAASLLLQYGADINAQNDYGHTALIIAVSEKNPAMVEFLLEQGASVFLRNNHGLSAWDIIIHSTTFAMPKYDSTRQIIKLLREGEAIQVKRQKKLRKPTSLCFDDLMDNKGNLSLLGKELAKDKGAFLLMIRKAAIPYPQKKEFFMATKNDLSPEEKKLFIGALARESARAKAAAETNIKVNNGR